MVHPYSPATFSEQRHCVFPGFAWVPYQEASIFVLKLETTHQHILTHFQVHKHVKTFSPVIFCMSVIVYVKLYLSL